MHRKVIKLFSLLLIAIAMFFLIAAASLIALTNPNDYKDEIGRVVYEKTRQKLIINGNISWAFSPIPSLKINDIAFSNTGDTENKKLIKVGEADAGIELLPLLSKRIKISRLNLKNLQLDLALNAGSKNDLRKLLLTLGAILSDKNKPRISSTQMSAVNSFKIGKLTADDSAFAFTDQNHSAARLTLKSENINLQKPFSIELELKTANLPITVATKLILNYARQNLDSERIAVKVANVSARASLHANKIFESPNLSGEVVSDNFNPKDLLSAFGWGFDNKKENILTAASIKTNYQAGKGKIRFSELHINIDDAAIQGTAEIDLTPQTPQLKLDLDLSNLDLDRYTDLHIIKTASLQPTQRSKTPLKPNHGLVPSPSNWANNASPIKYAGTIHLSDITIGKIHAKKARLNLTYENSFMQINSLQANLYHGELNGNAKVNFNLNQPKITGNIFLKNFEVSTILQDAAKASGITGLANLKLNFVTRGRNSSELLHNLNGIGNFGLENGVWHGIDIAYQIDLANAIIHNKPLPTPANPPQTEFGRWTGTFKIADGKLQNDDLLIRASHFKVEGKGAVDLINQSLHFQLAASEKDRKFSVPIIVTGTITSPKFQPDLQNIKFSFFKSAAGKDIENKISDQLEKHFNIKKEETKALLKKLNLNLDKIFGK